MQTRNHALHGTRVHVRVGARRTQQRGFTLIETMAALLIFGVGVLGITRLQSVAVQETTAAGLRSDAALLTKNLIGRMWMSDRSPGSLQANFSSSPAGPGYTAWMTAVTAARLPGATANPPQIVFQPLPSGTVPSVPSTLVTITVFWQAPGDRSAHKYVETAQIK